MRALITGGAGFIGRHLSERLLNAGHQVTAIDNFSTGSRANIAAFRDAENYRLVVGNICESELLPSLVLESDFVFHLAASLGVRLIVERPTRCMENNLRGTERVLQLAHDLGKPVLIASTSEVYGKSSTACQEDQNLVFGNTRSLRWSYACSKALNEFMGIAYSRHQGLPLVIARLFNTVGPFQSAQYGMVVPRFVRAALANEPLEVYGDGQQSRCFCDVRDVTDALIALAQTERARGEVFNVGSDIEITVDELADRVIELTNSRSSKVYVPFETVYGRHFEETRRRVPDLTKIRQAIGYEPRVTLDETIIRIVRQMELDSSRAVAAPSPTAGASSCCAANGEVTVGATSG
jgi:UDP-glucose 4-epimerase